MVVATLKIGNKHVTVEALVCREVEVDLLLSWSFLADHGLQIHHTNNNSKNTNSFGYFSKLEVKFLRILPKKKKFDKPVNFVIGSVGR